MAVPAIPQRPARSQNIDIPSVPPRPRKSKDRSVSPSRNSYAPSPLNEPGFFPPGGQKSFGGSSLSRSIPKDIIQRPPSVNLPSVGQEGAEYEHTYESDTGSVEQTKTVPGELPLHAPKASLPASTAKSRIAAVTRTDSNAAAAIGIGKPTSESTENLHGHSNLSHEISRSSTSQQRSRPASIYQGDADEEHGIPEIGQKSGLIPNAGDVQAPTPTPESRPGISQLTAPGSGGSRNHFRTKSGREMFRGPPGSYGLHGHGVNSADPLEKKWYERHPEALARESEGEYGPKIPMERKQYNLSSAELNRIVHTPEIHEQSGTPDEQIGYLASEEYTQRLSSPRPPSANKRRSQTYADSPLRKMSFPEHEKPGFQKGVENEDNDDEVIHVDPHAPHLTDPVPSSFDGAEDGEFFDQPILAADEVRKRPEGQFMTPAVEYDEHHGFGESLSRSHSRSNSVQHVAPPILHRAASAPDRDSTPLEDVREYEPLFPDDDGKPLKRVPSEAGEHLPRHHFPSKDIWEDTPESAYYETTVETPQIPEFARREAEHEERELFESDVPKPTKVTKSIPEPKAQYSKGVRSEMTRPGLRNRFPSQDVWEDAPDSSMYTTTLDPEDETPAAQNSSPTERKMPVVPARPKPQVPNRPSKLSNQEAAEGVPLAKTISGEEELSFAKTKPPVPARPAGSKISALRGAFMNDLASRIQAGPQAPKQETEEEVQEEKAPLADARKGRARGPARRKPGVSPSGSDTGKSVPKVSFMSAVTIWEIDEEGSISVPSKATPAVVDELPEETTVSQ